MEDEAVKCSQWTAHGRCRNKVAAVIPRGPYQRALCRKHANEHAEKVLGDNSELVWALDWRGAQQERAQ